MKIGDRVKVVRKGGIVDMLCDQEGVVISIYGNMIRVRLPIIGDLEFYPNEIEVNKNES